jgi:hypothetical protein
MEIRALRADDLDSVKVIRARAFGHKSAAEGATRLGGVREHVGGGIAFSPNR